LAVELTETSLRRTLPPSLVLLYYFVYCNYFNVLVRALSAASCFSRTGRAGETEMDCKVIATFSILQIFKRFFIRRTRRRC